MLPNPNPLARIFNTLLLHALQDGARAIRLESGQKETRVEIRMDDARTIDLGPGAKETSVEFLVGEEWHPQMQIPDYVFGPLVAHLEAMQNAPDAIQLRFLESEKGLGIDLLLCLEKSASAQGERFEITIGGFNFEGNYDQKSP
ncbi:hypothetical protein B1R32_10578 [Abditibacterium utsteinense]|uniref:Uncharacterized protein n=1 Tax=Abditibacterium utsteinense TaxID=1960156 RepID=A0A2S8SUB3_9BACT|nr:hypothetical protein [Abditibacterium utsteinense]PQV64397.1 hypothetical protein B1R32_10578 [Abditibacterium utsteinense]